MDAETVEKVTGAARYTGDLTLPGVAVAGLLGSAHAHARILRVDTRRAAALPGVYAVLAAADLAGLDPYYGLAFRDQPVLAGDKVRYAGEPVAAVAAADDATVTEALAAIEVEYEPLPCVVDPEAALHAGAPVIHEEALASVGRYRDLQALEAHGGNLCHASRYELGNVAAGFAGADLVVEHVYEFPGIHHYPMEPFAALARWDGGRLEVWSATQTPYHVRDELATIFRLPREDVRVRVPTLGGSFGAKNYTHVEPVAAALARQAGRPVRLVLSNYAMFRMVCRGACRARVRTGVRRDGTLTAWDTEFLWACGAYAGNGPRLGKSDYHCVAPYRVPHVRMTSRVAYTNTVPIIPLRGTAEPLRAFARECQLDAVARAIGWDPLALRLHNLLAPGESFDQRGLAVSSDVTEGLRRAAAAVGWGTRETAPPPDGARRRGRGFACAVKPSPSVSLSEVALRLGVDGRLEIATSAVEMGQGMREAVRRLAGAALGLPPDRITVTDPDTDSTPFEQATTSSRTTMYLGQAVERAARALRATLAERLAARQGRPLGAVALTVDGADLQAGDQRVALTDLAAGAPLEATAHYESSGSAFTSEISMAAAEIEVDTETGELTVLRYASVVEAGAVVNGPRAHGQNLGSAVYGLGPTLAEEMVYADDGTLLNGQLFDYAVPRVGDAPRAFTSLLLEDHGGEGPNGARGIGEAGTLCAAPAIANALRDALGIPFCALPFSPPRIVEALAAAKAAAGAATDAAGAAAAPDDAAAPDGVAAPAGSAPAQPARAGEGRVDAD